MPQLLTRRDPEECLLQRGLDLPSWDAPFGADLQGCDLLAQTLHGGRTDVVLSRSTDAWAGIPLVLGGVVLLSTTDERGPLQVGLVLVLFG